MGRLGPIGIGLGSPGNMLLGAGGSSIFHPVDIGNWDEFWDASIDANTLTLVGADITTWTGSTGAHNWTDGGVAGQRPDASSTINGVRVVNTDGVGEWLVNTTLDRAVPSTTPTYWWGIFLFDTAANFEVLCQAQGGASRLSVSSINASGDLQMANTTLVNTNTTSTVGQAFRLYAGFTATTGDFLKVNDTSVTGASAGASDPAAGLWLGSRGGAASTFFDGKIACIGIRSTPLTAGEEAQLKAWATARYGTP